MENKYNLTIEDNIFLAKRNIVDYVYNSARLEGIAITFSQTEAILSGAKISNLTMDEVVTINNLKHAWQFLFETIDYPMADYPFICEVNRIIGSGLFNRAGFIRNIPVKIGGTSWKPDMPLESQIKDDISDILNIKADTDRALTLMLYLMRKQMFLDGNKRTATLCANKILITAGAGVLSVDVDDIEEFKNKLIVFYETNDMLDIKTFLYKKCIDGAIIKEISPDEIKAQQDRTRMFDEFRNSIDKVKSLDGDL